MFRMRVHQDVQELRGATVFAPSYFNILHTQEVTLESVAPANWFCANRLPVIRWRAPGAPPRVLSL